MDGGEATIVNGTPAPERARAAGIFLHAGWRSCGTWIWEVLRENRGVQAYYEPLHEDLARLRGRDIGLLRPDSWLSGHGAGAPYFAEYANLLRPSGGVRGHAARFAFDDYFRTPEQDDPDLEGYLRGLLANAASSDCIPVLKFCRSLGRVAWMEARFPDVLHVVILRNPLAQWASARRQMEQNGNRYFVVAPFVILARNAQTPLLAEAAERLGVKWPPGIGRSLTRDLSVTADACWRHVSRLSWQDRFRGFLALWAASGISSMQGRAVLIDADRITGDAQERGAAEAVLMQALGVAVDLTSGTHAAEMRLAPAERREAACCVQAASDFLQAQRRGLTAEKMAILTNKLHCEEMPSQEAFKHGGIKPTTLAYADAAAYIALMRASYPLRRAHFHVRRWMDSQADREP